MPHITAVIAAVVVTVLGLILAPKSCPSCGTRLPKFRTPTSARQALLGGGTCPKCGLELDSRGRPLKKQA